MANSILQSFLNNQFLKTDEPAHIAGLEKASAEVQKILMKKRRKIISYTLVALDPTVSDDDAMLREAEDVIIKQWPVFRNSVAKTKDTPSTYIQAVILDALDKISKDEGLAAIIWLTGCSIVNYYKLAGREKLLTDFLLQIGKKVEEAARSNWAILGNPKIAAFDPIEFVLPKVNEGRVDEEGLQSHLKAAAGHSGWAAQIGGGENPGMPNQGNYVWPKFFAERAARGLATEINDALSTQRDSIEAVADSIKDALDVHFAKLKPHLEQVLSSIAQSSKSVNGRLDLIWWKQALYSPTLDSSYRTLTPVSLAVTMAVDLAVTVPPIYPRSVDALLKETLRDVLGTETDTVRAIAELLKPFHQLPDPVKHSLENLRSEDGGRKSLGACVADLVEERMNTEEFFERTGLEAKDEISFGELSVWLFHDLQANRLANVK